MPKKPDKYGIKFWVLVDLETKFCLALKPYTGADPNRAERSLGCHVVMELIQPFSNKGFNITADNFFTSCELAEELGKKKTTLVGTLRTN